MAMSNKHMTLDKKQRVGNMARVAMVLLLMMMMMMGGGARARSIVRNESNAPIVIQKAGGVAAGSDEAAVVVGPHMSMELPAALTSSEVSMTNQLTGGTSGAFSLRRNAVMLVQSTGGLLSNTVIVLIGTLVQGIFTALSVFIASL